MSQTPTATPLVTERSGRATRFLTGAAVVVSAAAALTVGSVLVTSSSTNVQAHEVDLASEQRLLTERIGDSVAALTADPTNDAARSELAQSSTALREIRLGLTRGDATLGLDGSVPSEFTALYSPTGLDLDARMSRYERAAEDIAAVPGAVNSSAAAMIDAESSNQRLVTDLGQTVNALTAAQDSHVAQQAQRSLAGVLAMGVLGLVSLAAAVSIQRRRRGEQTNLDTTFSGTRRFIEAQSASLERERAAVAELVELDATRSQFVSNISHELRMPLTSMVGYLEVLGDEEAGELNEQQREMVGTAIRNGQRLGRLADDLLMLSLGELGDATTSRDLVDLTALAADVADLLAPQAADARVTLTATHEAPVFVRGDRRQLERVMLHLVGRSIKLTPAEGRVGIAVAADPIDASNARITIVDTAATGSGSKTDGPGLGLAIAERFIHSHGGNIEISSIENATAVFISLPTVEVDSDGSALATVAWPIGSRLREAEATTSTSAPAVAVPAR